MQNGKAHAVVVVASFLAAAVFLAGCQGTVKSDSEAPAASDTSAASETPTASEPSVEQYPVAAAFNDELDAGTQHVTLPAWAGSAEAQSYALVEMDGDGVPELLRAFEYENGSFGVVIQTYDQGTQQVKQVGEAISFDSTLRQGEGESGATEYGYGFVYTYLDDCFFVSIVDGELSQQVTSSHQPLRPLTMYRIESRSAIDALHL